MDTLLYVENLTVSFDGFLALRNLNLIVERDERVRLLIGPNGAGKTTLVDALTGHVTPSAGRALFRDTVNVLGMSPHAIANAGVIRKFQTPSVFPGHTVFENMLLSAGRKRFTSTLGAGRGFHAHDAIVAVLDQVGLRERAGDLAGTLSHGEQQWLEIAMLLVQEPRLLLLDEPAAGMTRPEKERTGALIEAIMGRNGVGKTTLLKTIVGLLAPRAGAIEFRGRDITRRPPYERARLGIGYVPQGRDIFPALTVHENLVLGARQKRPAPARLDYVLSLFPGLGELLGKRGGDLSGGQQQQLAIARALIADPALLLLDEPTEGIQPSIVDEIADVLRRIKREGNRSILLVEQYLEFARSICDRFYVMDKGVVALEGERQTFDVDAVSALLSV